MTNYDGLNSLLTQREDSRTQKGKDHQFPTSHDDRLYVLGCTFYLSTYKVNTEGWMQESHQMGWASIDCAKCCFTTDFCMRKLKAK